MERMGRSGIYADSKVPRASWISFSSKRAPDRYNWMGRAGRGCSRAPHPDRVMFADAEFMVVRASRPIITQLCLQDGQGRELFYDTVDYNMPIKNFCNEAWLLGVHCPDALRLEASHGANITRGSPSKECAEKLQKLPPSPPIAFYSVAREWTFRKRSTPCSRIFSPVPGAGGLRLGRKLGHGYIRSIGCEAVLSTTFNIRNWEPRCSAMSAPSSAAGESSRTTTSYAAMCATHTGKPTSAR
ncbi:hypothetical protein EJ06DRAFT_419428 [Trichodelitschia bisporula]|uniref:Uncharacterized protein n=1 Tax=Trichodelitschia bisporula TaxID=703511 RepID=A0A6G1HVS5_9PEZI|nr:hypothetical protein EJ06DRAFT_419428 [Trichodelitschia bisporula]